MGRVSQVPGSGSRVTGRWVADVRWRNRILQAHLLTLIYSNDTVIILRPYVPRGTKRIGDSNYFTCPVLV